ncbi:SUMF1/EgtB/PvdO family nonheme iron enzyme [Aetokthonos hydrillicola Thurmond2011]|jgi:formylglycine-generating enzyme required for sulfatase activity/uncharacterized protein with von Willebrand factor type A (vWA) domain|uniref:SUMF1/EgtB/PvdO family nonheme iron enzyme n=1 Tax=Aetokthonos hydrillicola Thurmond2011 TaxID=2712845 RepID=A0AAP5I424_9CYAN|nr:SUMF1/EgtB/PvdO family nonheme iron enzyme [Aetokthonos hydrillicola]MBO3457634.1 SUMF1/EgtB/PvdO family nonheme iron enzyme [Aetokthonos hydrillicola CCALA 1050]MBW4587913.1 SUMF1/EgtB/PvdO family nonheme iron enzyme [Aetokthonos hydrillicola CCALA 1050]MDR9894682.1 SUMF1/EgtB/PvdO family nonheme iron enzyme [Aetokthonos hydrillicola Thurmond2011]
MTPNDLLKLFYGLRQAGLPLRIEDYQLLCQAWDKGFKPENYRELRKLCQRLWVKSVAERQCFENYFDQCLQEWSSQGESEFSPDQPHRRTTQPEQTPQTQPTPQYQPYTTTPDTPENLDIAQAVNQSQHTNKLIPPGKFTLNDEYFPVTRRQMEQGWRKLRQPIRQGSLTDLDIPATIKRISQEGFFLETVLLPNKVNQTKLLLLIDQSNSMIPFAPLSERLVETAIQQGRLGETKVYYFRNSFRDFLYLDPDLLEKKSLTEIIPHLHKNHTVVLIFSDGGAARGGLNLKRVELTEKFLTQIRPVVRQIAWLNPLPVNRWRGTTANWLAKLVSMYPFNLTEWRRMIDEQRGGQKFLREYNYQDTEKNSGFSSQVENRLKQIQPAKTSSDDFTSYETASRYIADFAKLGRSYLDLAYHAAFPLAITPNLLYYLRENFPYDQQGKKLNIPWLAVGDLLLSNLCNPAGGQLYEMDSTVRHLLLKLLQTDKRFGNQRLEQLSDCLLFYIQQKFNHTALDIKDFGDRPEWIALAYTKPNELARELAQMLEQIYSQDKVEKIRTVSLPSKFAEPLAEHGFEPLLTFARGWGRKIRGYEESANELFDQISSELDVEGVKLKIPNRPDLPRFSFEVVTVDSKGRIIKREHREAQYFVENLGNNVTLEMVAIPGGTFIMGAPETEEGSSDEQRPQHKVTVPPFFMGKYPVTQAQWEAVAILPQVNRELKRDPSQFKGKDLPAENIFWDDAVEFCARLSKATGRNYRLPSEAEWEYACRAGTTTPFHFGQTITSELANYYAESTYGGAPKGNHRQKTTPVGSFRVANAFGLYDMHGNIWEWCTDDWHENYDGAPDQEVAWLSNKNIEGEANIKLLRGGSWDVSPRFCRSAYRVRNARDSGSLNVGFRVVVVGAARTL